MHSHMYIWQHTQMFPLNAEPLTGGKTEIIYTITLIPLKRLIHCSTPLLTSSPSLPPTPSILIHKHPRRPNPPTSIHITPTLNPTNRITRLCQIRTERIPAITTMTIRKAEEL